MTNFEFFFLYHFDGEKIRNSRIETYTIDHVNRLVLHNTSHEYDIMIGLTNDALINLQKKMGSKTETRMDRMADTITVDEAESKYLALVKRAVGTVTAKYDKSSAMYKEFFGESLSNYSQPTRTEILKNCEHFISRLTTYSEFGTALLDDFNDLKDMYSDARSTQLTAIDKVDELIEEESAERTALNKQLAINVLTLAIKYMGKPEMAKEFMDASLLYPHGHTVVTPGVVHSLKIKPLVMKNSQLEGLQEMIISVNVTHGKVQLWAASSPAKPTPSKNAVIVTVADGKKELKMAEIGNTATDKYLIVYNPESTESDVEVEITGGVKYN